MKKTIFFIGIAIIIFVLGGWIIFSNKIIQLVPEKNIKVIQENLKENKIFLIINNSENDTRKFEVEFNQGITVFDVLKDKTRESNTVLKTKTYDIGTFIEQIGDKKNGQDGKYWIYYVNNKMSIIASDKQKVEPGDTIEFKFEKSPF